MARNRKFRVKDTLTEVWLKLNFERAVLRSVFHLDPEVKFENWRNMEYNRNVQYHKTCKQSAQTKKNMEINQRKWVKMLKQIQ